MLWAAAKQRSTKFTLIFRCKVSNFSSDLLTKIAIDPLFNIEDINPSLYKKVKQLSTVRVSWCLVSLEKNSCSLS